MKKITSIFLASVVCLASCAHEMTAHKDVAEEKIVFAPDPPADDDAGVDPSPDDDAGNDDKLPDSTDAATATATSE
jgi:hypothetical protein